jgi:hypothetical protein
VVQARDIPLTGQSMHEKEREVGMHMHHGWQGPATSHLLAWPRWHAPLQNKARVKWC